MAGRLRGRWIHSFQASARHSPFCTRNPFLILQQRGPLYTWSFEGAVTILTNEVMDGTRLGK